MKNIIKGIFDFVKESRQELTKVKWPQKEQTQKYTKSVIYFSVAMACFLGLMDYMFTLLISRIL